MLDEAAQIVRNLRDVYRSSTNCGASGDSRSTCSRKMIGTTSVTPTCC